MPTQEQFNAANTELQIANDNYAALANRYNKYQELFRQYTEASPETKEKAKDAIKRALDDFERTKLDMYAAQDRIQQAQSVINNYNNAIATAKQSMPTRKAITGNVWPNNTIITQEVPNTIASNNGNWTVSYTESDWTVVTVPIWSVPLQNNPYFNLYNQYAQIKATWWDLWTFFNSIKEPVSQVHEWLKNTDLEPMQRSDFIYDWWLAIKNKMNNSNQWSWTTTNTANNSFWWAGWIHNADGSMTSADWKTKVYADWSISFWPTSTAQTNTTSTPRRKFNVVKAISNRINSVPDKVIWAWQMTVATPGLLTNTAKTIWAYNQMTDWNWISWIRNNVQWWLNFVNSIPATVSSADKFLRGYNRYKGRNFN